MLKLLGRSLSLTVLTSAIILTFAIIVFLMAVVLAGEGPVMKGISCQIGLSEDCVRQELQKQRQNLREMQRKNRELMARNQETEALLERLAALDHASSSYVIFYEQRGHRHTVSTGHTYKSLVDPDTLIGAHCYFFASEQGAGSLQIWLGKMNERKHLTINSYRASELRGTGLSQSDIAALQALCKWPAGAS